MNPWLLVLAGGVLDWVQAGCYFLLRPVTLLIMMGAQRFRRDCRRRGSTPRPTNLVNPGGKPQTL